MKQLLCALMIFLGFLNLFSWQSYSQTKFDKFEANPLIVPGTGWISAGVPFVYLMESEDSLKMWFTAATGASVSVNTIGYASSVDGINFQLPTGPVLGPTQGTGFDSKGVFGASVLFDGTVYRMWYNGYDTQPYYMGKMEVGLATSTDGQNWTNHSTSPVLPVGSPGSWDEMWAYQSTVLFEDGVYKMWYTGNDGTHVNIGYATSMDGITWDKFSGNPVFSSAVTGIDGQNPRILHTETGYEMWFNTPNSSLGTIEMLYTTSVDGIIWDQEISVVLRPGNNGEFDDTWVWYPMVIKMDQVYRMWYSGFNGNNYAVGYALDSTLIGISVVPPTQTPHQLIISVDPVSGKTMINLSNQHQSEGVLEILNSAGESVYIRMCSDFPVYTETSSWGKGIYFASFTCRDQVYKGKFIVR
jgi:beta-1,2-mannobiose phosphorylase / 1,2-beta-oligomannan phosphorylase